MIGQSPIIYRSNQFQTKHSQIYALGNLVGLIARPLLHGVIFSKMDCMAIGATVLRPI